MTPIRLGIIGCGRVAHDVHLPALRTLPEFAVDALADNDSDRLHRTADRFGIAGRFSNPGELLQDPRLDAIAICTPAPSHAELTVAALAAEKHVFVEKPLALDVADGERMVAAAQASEKVAVVGFNLRCHRLVRRARAMIESGALGQISQVVTLWGSDMQYHPGMPAWRRTFKTGGGALTEIGVHHIDACAFLLRDNIATVQMFDRSNSCEGESATLLARTTTGTLISLSVSQLTSPIHELRILGDGGVLAFSPFRADSFSFRRIGKKPDHWRQRLFPDGWVRELPELLRVMWSGGDYVLSIREEWKAFADAVRGRTAPMNTLADGLAALRVIEAARKSCARGAPVKLAEDEQPGRITGMS